MADFLLVTIGALCGLALSAGFLAGMALLFWPKLLPQKEPLIAWLALLRKISWHEYFEANLRAQTGKPLDRPYGTKRGILSLEKLQFNPVYLTKKTHQ